MTLHGSLQSPNHVKSVVPPGRRVCFLINSMEGGGAERAMANLINLLLPFLDAQQVELVLLDDFPCEQTLPPGLKVTTLPGRGTTLRSLLDLNRHWAKPGHRPDVCISFLARANIINVMLARRFRHKAIISERVNTSSHIAASRAEPVLARIIRTLYPRADRVLAVSAGVADDLVTRFGVRRQKISVIGNPVDGDRLIAMAKEEPGIDLPDDFFVGIGRLVANKNFALLLDAYARSETTSSLVILGQGPDLDSLRDQARGLGIEDRVIFAGFVRNPYPIVARARALVSASRAEGFPNTLVEAISLGCPVIATDCPSGPADVLGSDVARAWPWPEDAHGLLIPMEDVDAMAAAIRALDDDTVRRNYVEKATARAKDFGVTAATEAYLDILKEVFEPG
ncbi:glycosyltransferase [Gymnodinialimonas ceratoperidinii]|uniref:Glycosyltransferase n=1 Tax=Gymnodinialimonas ceratoperidinii TaxID=2856823 RepID=A0A8F6YAW5_9RHOB|nr:glycosyltransferase [Gymnodinialimonas ceratoperidinii]QXT39456.1 glycosyltransferase [Gymnodinialimonas ceratoperidinii]